MTVYSMILIYQLIEWIILWSLETISNPNREINRTKSVNIDQISIINKCYLFCYQEKSKSRCLHSSSLTLHQIQCPSLNMIMLGKHEQDPNVLLLLVVDSYYHISIPGKGAPEGFEGWMTSSLPINLYHTWVFLKLH
jgi:hypothetical protein